MTDGLYTIDIYDVIFSGKAPERMESTNSDGLEQILILGEAKSSPRNVVYKIQGKCIGGDYRMQVFDTIFSDMFMLLCISVRMVSVAFFNCGMQWLSFQSDPSDKSHGRGNFCHVLHLESAARLLCKSSLLGGLKLRFESLVRKETASQCLCLCLSLCLCPCL